MKRSRWIIGLSIAGVMALSGTAFALNSGSVVTQSAAQKLTARNISTQSQGTVANNGINTVNNSSPSTNQSTQPLLIDTTNSGITPGSNAPFGGYGMMGGYGGNGTGGGYGMMGGYGGNGIGGGYGMMGGYGGNGAGRGYGMMGGYGANGTGGGYGMMGGGYNAQSLGINLTNGEVSTSDQAVAIAKAYTQKVDQNVVADELHEFSNGYEAEFKDAKTGAKAYEIMIYKNGGQIIAEMGPNIMWNSKYGPMNWGNAGSMTVSEEQAVKNAQDFVSRMGQEYSIEKPETAPGYYEFMVQKDGKDYAELDVNGYSGQVWYENWHGPILNTIEVK
ncbi:putative membrane protein [Desulfosporosinus acidiphilus SJ4]|uniref:Putative membrane protein n=1 Tax=Desulfosporosinus acidiphilus (strain DSM 22704 / JCM 16185 / SJ4) TaxID=646529 RepID=I4D4V9_DESAJ|nr:PepSY domain-containing protein [Desulfosporosinus acidiphilus]AFM40833.1 putative membrane protein [Desulfosporosinus acidiphilus SJ4]